MWFRVCVLCASSPELCFVHVLARWNAVCWSTRPSRWPCTSGAGLVLSQRWVACAAVLLKVWPRLAYEGHLVHGECGLCEQVHTTYDS
jgi:hypothetical protein